MRILYGHPRGSRKYTKVKAPKFEQGDLVRISNKDGTFKKGYLQNFTDEIFKVIKVHNGPIVTYTLGDKHKEIIKGKFYQPELVRVTKL